ncbi:ABC transporter permease subunit [Thermogladius sp. KZ2Tp1]|uniref:ABC transporter permease subunit n=1 Tax=Thermogladius sp. KZ2Tp1 TaxID=3136289 RepID=UPI003DA8A5CD
MVPELVVATLMSLYRMFAAYLLSLLIALFTGIAMARNRVVETVLLPILDVLQSIPILGFFPVVLSVLVYALGPGVGGELSAVVLITTSLVWNMIFGVYASVKSLDPSFDLMASVYRIPLPLKVALVYAPASRTSLLSNSIISWAGGWFFLTSAEVISMGSQTLKLVGLGSFIFDASNRGDAQAFAAGIAVLFAVILATYILLWNPAVVKYTGLAILPGVAAVYDSLEKLTRLFWRLVVRAVLKLWVYSRRLALPTATALIPAALLGPRLELPGVSAVTFYDNMVKYLDMFLSNVWLTLVRVYVVVLVSLLISLPLAYLSHRRRATGLAACTAGELLSSIPAVIWWPLLLPVAHIAPWFVMFFVYLQGALWYVYFNVMIFGLQYVKRDVIELADVYRVRGFLYFKSVFIPAMLPSILAGLLSASGGAWNASIAAEYIALENFEVDMGGVGSLIDKLAAGGDALGVLFVALYMSLVIVLLNRLVWRRLFARMGSRSVVD